MTETSEEYYLRMDEFLIYIKDEVNPARVNKNLNPIGRSEATACFRIIEDFNKRWAKKMPQMSLTKPKPNKKTCVKCGFDPISPYEYQDKIYCSFCLLKINPDFEFEEYDRARAIAIHKKNGGCHRCN